MFIKCVYFKSFTNVFQMFVKYLANFSFLVNNKNKFIHSLAAFSLRNISITICHSFSKALSGADISSSNTKVSVISKSIKVFSACIFWQIFADFVRSLPISTDLSRSLQILWLLSRSSEISADLIRSSQILTHSNISTDLLTWSF